MEQKRRPITLGQRFKHKREGTLYFVRDVSNNSVVLVSEDGGKLLRIQLDSLTSGSFELIYD